MDHEERRRRMRTEDDNREIQHEMPQLPAVVRLGRVAVEGGDDQDRRFVGDDNQRTFELEGNQHQRSLRSRGDL